MTDQAIQPDGFSPLNGHSAEPQPRRETFVPTPRNEEEDRIVPRMPPLKRPMRAEKQRDLDIRIVTPRGGGFVLLNSDGRALQAYTHWVDLMIALKGMVSTLPGEEDNEATDEDLRAMMGPPKRFFGLGLW